MNLKQIATLKKPILQDGSYTLPNGSIVPIDTTTCVQGTRCFTPAELDAMLNLQSADIEDLVILNFASARNPCDGYITGARAQEEDLARCSALHSCLTTDAVTPYYEANREKSHPAKDMLYASHMIYSLKVPFFRDRSYNLLEKPFQVRVISAPAPNSRPYLNRSKDLDAAKTKLSETLRLRTGKVLASADHFTHRNLLLGAWGCGVFGGGPESVADSFKFWLDHDRFRTSFDLVAFAVLAPRSRPNIIEPFERIANGKP